VSSAEVAAVAAQDYAREAAEVGRMEREREHDRLGPGPVPTIVTELESNPRSDSFAAQPVRRGDGAA